MLTLSRKEAFHPMTPNRLTAANYAGILDVLSSATPGFRKRFLSFGSKKQKQKTKQQTTQNVDTTANANTSVAYNPNFFKDAESFAGPAPAYNPNFVGF